jgi:hypothetical protein
VFILKGVKVVCFVIVLQLFILKVLAGSEERLPPTHVDTERKEVEEFFGGKSHAIPVFSYEWQGKDLREEECLRVANKGLRKCGFCKRAQRVNAWLNPRKLGFSDSAESLKESGSKGVNSPGRELRRVACRANIAEITILVYRLSSGFFGVRA